MDEIGWNDDAITAWLDKLADCFGGYSQLPDEVIGRALRGLVENGGFDRARVNAAIEQAAIAIGSRWEDPSGGAFFGSDVEFVEERIRAGYRQRGSS